MSIVNGKVVIEIEVSGDLDERYFQLKSKLKDIVNHGKLKDGCLHMSAGTYIKNTAGHVVAKVHLKDHDLF